MKENNLSDSFFCLNSFSHKYYFKKHMKTRLFQNYSKPPDISDSLRSQLIYDAIVDLSHRNCRIGDITSYLNDRHDNIEFDAVSTARIVYQMGKRIGWTCKEIEGHLYPVCYPASNCTELAVCLERRLTKL
jgi:hypothetical protein